MSVAWGGIGKGSPATWLVVGVVVLIILILAEGSKNNAVMQ